MLAQLRKVSRESAAFFDTVQQTRLKVPQCVARLHKGVIKL